MKQDKSVTVVGAGLVGSLLATLLSQKKYHVDVYERRPDMRKKQIDGGRSINLAISARGFHGVEQVGLKDEVMKLATPMEGRVMHNSKGETSFQKYGHNESDRLYSISRGGLNKLLMSAAEATGFANFHFEKPVTQVDLSTGEITVGQESQTLSPKHVIATDGSGSVIRKSLNAEEQSEFLDHGYKELTISPGKSNLSSNLHIWPRGTYMLIALPNLDGSFTCTLFLPFEGPTSFASLDSAQKVTEFFETTFPDALPLIDDLERTFFENPTGKLVTVRCSKWHHQDKFLMMGDASHAIVPFFGQGMNSGFEDVSVFGELLEKRGSIDEKLFEEFFRHRLKDTNAIAQMALENFIEMRDHVGNKQFLMKKKVEHLLHERFPDDYVSRYQQVTFSRVPYSKALQEGLVKDQILDTLCKNLEKVENLDYQLAEQLIHKNLRN